MSRRWARRAASLVGLILLGFCAWFLRHELLTLTGVSFVLRPPEWPGAPPIGGALTRCFGGLLLAAVAGYLAVCGVRRRFRLRSWAVPVPTLRMALGQTGVGLGDGEERRSSEPGSRKSNAR